MNRKIEYGTDTKDFKPWKCLKTFPRFKVILVQKQQSATSSSSAALNLDNVAQSVKPLIRLWYRVLWRQTTPAVIPGESPWNVNEVWCCDILSMLLKISAFPCNEGRKHSPSSGHFSGSRHCCSTVLTSCFLFLLLLFLLVSLECRFSYTFPQWRGLRIKHTHTHSLQPGECVLISCMGWRRWGPQSLSLCVQMVVSVTLLWLIRPCRGPVGQTCWLNRDRVYVTKKTHTHGVCWVAKSPGGWLSGGGAH